MNRRVTSHDVARLAGVSQSTVSLVLNGRVDVRIPEGTRQRVIEAAKELHYSKNAAARALVTGKTHRIGIVPIGPHSFLEQGTYYSDLMQGVLQGALQTSYNLLLHSSYYLDWYALYQDIMGGGADGVLLIGRHPKDELTLALLEASYPMVCVSYQPDKEPYLSIDCDNEMGGYLAVQHLLELGHRRIGYFCGFESNSWVEDRCQGARRALAEAGLPNDCLLLLPDSPDSNFTPQSYCEQALVLLEQTAPPITAFIFNYEEGAQQMAEALPEYGIRVPQDVSIISFNSTSVSERSSPTLTSVWQPLVEIGKTAVEMLIGSVEGNNAPSSVKRFPMRLDIRESSGPVASPL